MGLVGGAQSGHEEGWKAEDGFGEERQIDVFRENPFWSVFGELGGEVGDVGSGRAGEGLAKQTDGGHGQHIAATSALALQSLQAGLASLQTFRAQLSHPRLPVAAALGSRP